MSHLIDRLRILTKGNLSGLSFRLVHLAEAIAVAFSIYLAIKLLVFRLEGLEITWNYYIFGILLFMSWLALSQLTTLAILPRTQRYQILFVRFLQVSFIEFIVCAIIWIAIGRHSIHFMLVPLYVIVRFTLTILIRILSYKIFKHYRARGYNTRYLVVFADHFSDGIIEKLIYEKEWGFQVKYIISNSKLIKAKFGEKVRVYRENADLRYLLDCDVIDEVIYCKNKIENKQMMDILKICEEVGVLFRMQSHFSPLKPIRLELQTINMSTSFQLVDTPSNSFGYVIKNITDIYVSAIALLLLSPLFLLISVIIKLGSKGPVLFIQERIGLRGRKFNLIKFRTMVQGAESDRDALEKDNEADGPVFKIKNDPRVTRIGRFLRKTGLDELPQLFNVVKGEMSLIGPRPPIEQEVVQYKRWHLRRLSVKPGITCTWQVLENRNDVPFEKWMHLDLDYIDNWTLKSDAKLLFKTFNTVVKANGH
jgi:exopolysaccharide biosynthesis polyprenyl glycosylphosphotransferase